MKKILFIIIAIIVSVQVANSQKLWTDLNSNNTINITKYTDSDTNNIGEHITKVILPNGDTVETIVLEYYDVIENDSIFVLLVDTYEYEGKEYKIFLKVIYNLIISETIEGEMLHQIAYDYELYTTEPYTKVSYLSINGLGYKYVFTTDHRKLLSKSEERLFGIREYD